MLFQKVTVSKEEYLKHCELRFNIPNHLVAMYFDGMVWIKKLDPLSLLHEYIHHVMRSALHYPKYGNLTLFSDFTDCLFDTVWGLLRYSSWRRHIWEAIDDLKTTWSYFNDFVRCIDFEKE